MGIESILVVAKKTTIERYVEERPDPKFRRLVEAGDPMVARARATHDAHRRALDVVRAVLDARGLPWQIVYSTRSAKPNDLVLAVGGDGTLLDASHGVVDQPVLLVNSFPQTSVGFFAGATAETFAERLDQVIAGTVEPVSLNRIAVEVDGRPLTHPALNDILLAHENPAATSSYVIRVDGEEEKHVSSGVWVSTAAGSTAAIRAAGGVRQPLLSRDLQYLVRELYRAPGSSLRLTGGIVSDSLEFVSRMYEGAVFLDGHRLRHAIGYADRIVVRAHAHPLCIYLFDRRQPSRDTVEGAPRR